MHETVGPTRKKDRERNTKARESSKEPRLCGVADPEEQTETDGWSGIYRSRAGNRRWHLASWSLWDGGERCFCTHEILWIDMLRDGFSESGPFCEFGRHLHVATNRCRDRTLVDVLIHDRILRNPRADHQGPYLVG